MKTIGTQIDKRHRLDRFVQSENQCESKQRAEKDAKQLKARPLLLLSTC